MAIKVSDILASNTNLVVDSSLSLGENLDVAGFSINNGLNPVTISGNSYPITTVHPGQ